MAPSKETLSSVVNLVKKYLVKPFADGVPQHLLLTKIFNPAMKFRAEHLSVHGLRKDIPTFFNFLFKKSDETAVMLLVFNAISILSSHANQIIGLAKSPLKKSNNKESANELKTKRYLITQELCELGLDIVLTIVPPFLLTGALSRKLYSGEWLSKDTKKKIINEFEGVLGVQRDELFYVKPKIKFNQKVGISLAKFSSKIKEDDKLFSKFKKLSEFIDKNVKVDIPKRQYKFDTVSLKELAANYDQAVKALPLKLMKEKQALFRNGSAYDDIIGQIEGTKTLAAIAYTAVFTAIVTPFLKNIIANSLFKKEKVANENVVTPAPLRPVVSSNFDTFAQFNSTVKPNTVVKPTQNKPLFSEFNNSYSGLNYSGRMKI